MAVTQTALTSGSNSVDATSFATASISPTANRLVLVAIAHNTDGGTFYPSSVSGAGLTFTEIGHSALQNFSGASLWRALSASPSTGAITIGFGANTAYAVAWSISEFDGIDTGGTNGSAAIVQSVVGDATGVNSITATLAAFGSADNATFGVFSGREPSVYTDTVGTGFTGIHDVIATDVDFGFYYGVHTQWRSDNDTSVDRSFSADMNGLGVVAVEIKAAAAGGTGNPWYYYAQC